MNKCFLSIAALAACALTSNAFAQVPTLYNPGFEITFTGFPAYAKGWRLNQTGQTSRREIGDGMTPATQVHHGIASVFLPGGDPNPNTVPPTNVYQAAQSEELVDATHRNWPEYVFDAAIGTPIYISCWFMIPADDPMVGTKFGMHVNFIRTVNQSVYRDREWLDVDPDTSIAPLCGTTVVDLGGGIKGIHTNGQWVKFSVSVNQQEDFNDPATGMPYPLPPVNPAYASVFALRFGTVHATGTVWVDDVEFSQTPPCRPDYNGDGVISVQDIFEFLNGWFAGNCRADYNRVNGISVQDIFDFLNGWFAGC